MFWSKWCCSNKQVQGCILTHCAPIIVCMCYKSILLEPSPCAFRRLNVKLCQQAIHECCIFECSKCIVTFALQQGQIKDKKSMTVESLIVILFKNILQSLDNTSNNFYFDLCFLIICWLMIGNCVWSFLSILEKSEWQSEWPSSMDGTWMPNRWKNVGFYQSPQQQQKKSNTGTILDFVCFCFWFWFFF